MPSFSEFAKDAASRAGFDLCGVVTHPFEEVAHFERWIASGYAGDMNYLSSTNDSGELKRSNLENALPWTRSAIICAINYNPAAPLSTDITHKSSGWISRYAIGGEDGRGADYHDELLRRLRTVESELIAEFGEMQSRCYVDTGPIVERALAQAAGIGWIGKNTCLIHQQQGSWLFLGVIVTSHAPAEHIATIPHPDRCGSCTRCIDACPTDALIDARQMDARRCIAYLTIEKRGDIPEEFRPAIGNNVFGCDICQDVCPWNSRAPITSAPAFAAREELIAPDLEFLANLSLEQWRELFRGSPVKRTKYQGFMRNVCIAIGNSGDARFLPRLQDLAGSDDVVIAEHARWAVDHLHHSPNATEDHKASTKA